MKPRKGLSLRGYDRFFQYPLLGMDEVGTGAVAGPIYAAGVVLPKDDAVLTSLEKLGLRDSKKMTEVMRERVLKLLVDEGVHHWVSWRHPNDIEALGHHAAIGQIFNDIISCFRAEMGMEGTILIDGDENKNVLYHVDWIQKGDDRSLAIAAASVVAKVSRDRFMTELAADYPGYAFEVHKGYLTRTHQEALEKLGASDAHRAYTKPIKAINEARRLPL